MENDFRKKAQVLCSIVNNTLGVKMLGQSRVKKMMDARKIFSKIMRDNGWRLDEIGDFMGKDHASVIRYCRDADFRMKYDDTFVGWFRTCAEEYRKFDNTCINMSKRQLVSSVNRLQKEVWELSVKVGELEQFKVSQNIIHERFGKVIDMMVSRTPRGKEDWLYLKLNAIFNGL
jgi:hypothetical protein